ncbi:MAG: FAD-dependent oxidoreductase [Synergistaceae bacterium]|nr:FAD-dependent oxidoreductase [Synergistaceae bacterium]
MHKFLILGAGPAGLAFANRLLQNGQRDFLVLEAEHEAGGLCRSQLVDGSPLDIGGGHILDVRRPEVVKFLFAFMPRDEWNHFTRDSRIHLNGQYISHPFEANIWQLGSQQQVEYLSSIAKAGCVTGKPKPEKFTDWILWKLGEKIAHDYMLPYNTKMFGDELDSLGTYWLEKLPDVSFEDTLRSCLEHKAYAKQPGHAEFYYPVEHGYGELWLRMAEALDGRVIYNQRVKSLCFDSHIVRTEDGAEYHGEIIISTIPYREFAELYGMPEELRQSINSLKHTSVEVKYSPESLDTPAQWIYYPDLSLRYHRIFLRHNVLPNSKGIWYETNADRAEPDSKNFAYMNKYAYPLNTIDKPRIMNALLDWMKTRNVYGLGRWGEHQHYNSDLTVELGIRLADELA